MPRKYPWFAGGQLHEPRRFNEAGADAPEIPALLGLVLPQQRLASMRPGRMPRKYLRTARFRVAICPTLQ